MVLTVHSVASYLSDFGGKSRAGDHYFLTNKHNDIKHGLILTLSSIIKHVLSSASEAELVALFYHGKQTVPLQVTLVEMRHPDNLSQSHKGNGRVFSVTKKLPSLKPIHISMETNVIKTLPIIIQNITRHLIINNGAALTFVTCTLLNSKNPNQEMLSLSYC